MRKAKGNYVITPPVQRKFTEWRHKGKFIIPSECYFVWLDVAPNATEIGFHVLLKVVQETEDIGWFYEQGYLTAEGNYFRLGNTRFTSHSEGA